MGHVTPRGHRRASIMIQGSISTNDICMNRFSSFRGNIRHSRKDCGVPTGPRRNSLCDTGSSGCGVFLPPSCVASGSLFFVRDCANRQMIRAFNSGGGSSSNLSAEKTLLLESTSPHATAVLAAYFAQEAHRGDCYLLYGDVGSGKSFFR